MRSRWPTASASISPPNRSLPLDAHHDHLHTGRAGEAQFQAGNVVVPGAPLTPWANCAELIDFFFGD